MGKGPGRRPPSRIHAGLVGDRTLVGTAYLGDPQLRRQYVEEIAPRTVAALGKILIEVWPPERATAKVRVLDLGSGTGAAAQAIRAHAGPYVEVLAVDKVPGPGVLVADLRRPGRPLGVSGRFDLILAAHLLNELQSLSVTERAQLVESWCRELLLPGGLCIVIEPALRETSRALLGVRDLLLDRRLRIIAPCLCMGPCPALERPRDWCHDAAPWPASEAARPRGTRVDFSYLVISADPGPTVTQVAATEGQTFRVVSDPLKEKGRLRLFGCGPSGRHALVRQNRDETCENETFGSVGRGERLHVGPTRIAGDGLRIGPDTQVRRG